MRTLFRKVFDWSQISYYISYYIYYSLFVSQFPTSCWVVGFSPVCRWRAATKTEVGRYEGSLKVLWLQQSGGNSKSGGFLTWSFIICGIFWDCFSDGRFWIRISCFEIPRSRSIGSVDTIDPFCTSVRRAVRKAHEGACAARGVRRWTWGVFRFSIFYI